MSQPRIPLRKIVLWLVIGLAISSVLLVLASRTLAGVEAISLPWWTVDSGGGESRGGNFVLNGAVGQADAGSMSGGTFKLSGGFWAGTGAPQPAPKKVFMPFIVR